MPFSSKRVFFSNHVFAVWENVYEPAEDSFLFAENLEVSKGDVVVDMGTGCGMLGIIAAEKAAKVLAVDINPYAIRCARKNAKSNRVVEKMLLIQGDLFTPIRTGERFDLILFNAPYLPSEIVEENSWLGRSWAGGASGRKIIDRFVEEAPKYLSKNGRILIMQSTLSGLTKTLKMLERNGLRGRVVAKQSLPLFETILLVSAEPQL